MIASAVLSMFVSNTATAIMMLPIAMSVFELVEGQSRSGRSGTGQSQAGHPQTEHSQAERRNFEIALVLSVAYGCNVGGIGTLIGTPPNALLAGFFQETYGVEIGFLDWMLVGMPIVLISLPVIFFLLTRVLFPIRMQELDGGMDYIRGELAQMGPMSVQEKRVAMVFTLAALGWVTRPLLEEYVPGLSDAGISVGAAVLLFMIPAGGEKKAGRGIFSGSVGVQGMGGARIGHKEHKESEDASSGASQTRLLHWRNTTQLPWGILILFGGGLSMAAAIQSTGLAAWIGTSLSIFQNLPILLMVFLIVLMMIFLTELTSNTASTAAFLPVLAALALGTGADPILFAVPAAIAASCAFMLPVATPPNAIVYGTGRITIAEMSKAGLWLNLLFSVWITLASYFLLRWIFTG
jgi:sodium-dependent dicarboxylate transporter 2/3/5